MGYDVKLTDQQIKDKTTYQYAIEVTLWKITTKPSITGDMFDTEEEVLRITTKRESLSATIQYAQAVLDLEFPGRKHSG